MAELPKDITLVSSVFCVKFFSISDRFFNNSTCKILSQLKGVVEEVIKLFSIKIREMAFTLKASIPDHSRKEVISRNYQEHFVI